MAVDKLVDSTQLDADLTSIANAIRTKGGTSASLAFPAGFVSAIGDIPSGGGGAVQTGTFTVVSDITVASTGTDINIGFSGQPDYVQFWLDKDDYDDLASPPANYYWCVLAKQKSTVFSTYPPFRYSASVDIQTQFAGADYICRFSKNVANTTDPNTVNGKSLNGSSWQTSSTSPLSINNDGTITLTSGGNGKLLAGEYHYVVATGLQIIPW